jgi:hypothetical protein
MSAAVAAVAPAPAPAAVAVVAAAASTAPANIFAVYAPAAIWLAGVITVTVSLILQVFAVDHGTSGQLTIDTGMHAALWPPIIGGAIFAFAFTYWIVTQKNEKYKFIYLFLLVAVSYLLSNVALFYSSRQVTVATT